MEQEEKKKEKQHSSESVVSKLGGYLAVLCCGVQIMAGIVLFNTVDEKVITTIGTVLFVSGLITFGTSFMK